MKKFSCYDGVGNWLATVEANDHKDAMKIAQCLIEADPFYNGEKVRTCERNLDEYYTGP